VLEEGVSDRELRSVIAAIIKDEDEVVAVEPDGRPSSPSNGDNSVTTSDRDSTSLADESLFKDSEQPKLKQDDDD